MFKIKRYSAPHCILVGKNVSLLVAKDLFSLVKIILLSKKEAKDEFFNMEGMLHDKI
jgi:hypothetical protein